MISLAIKTVVTPVLMHWSYYSLNIIHIISSLQQSPSLGVSQKKIACVDGHQ